MTPRQYIYDPETEALHNLQVGKLYSEARAATRGVCYLETDEGGVVKVPFGDLINKREKPVERLKAAAANLAYEADMLAKAFEKSSNRFAYTSWFVHFRNLWACLRGKGHDHDEVYAQDFFVAPAAWHKIRRAITQPVDLKRYHEAADELAVHLSYNRDRDIYLGVIPNRAITDFILELYDLLQSNVPDDKRNWFVSPL